MSPLIAELSRFWPYLAGCAGAIGAVLTMIATLQSLRKTPKEIKKLDLEIEAKRDEKQARIQQQQQLESVELSFEDIRIGRNPEWRELRLQELDADQNSFLEHIHSCLSDVRDITTLRYIVVAGPFWSSTPSVEIIVNNPTDKDILIAYLGIKVMFISWRDSDMPGGGGEDMGAYKVALSETYEIDASEIFCDLFSLFEERDEDHDTCELRIDKQLKVIDYEPCTVKSGRYFRYILRLINWRESHSAVVRFWIATKSNEILSAPFCIRYGGSVEAVYDRRDALLDELRALARTYPDDVALRERLAHSLFNSIYQTGHDRVRRDALLDELRALARTYPTDAAVREQLACGLSHCASFGSRH